MSSLALATVGIAIVSLLCAWILHKECFEALPFQPPVSGTPRAGYCDAVNPIEPWITLTLGPTLFFAGAALFLRKHPVVIATLWVAIAASLVANVVVVHGLEYAPEFP